MDNDVRKELDALTKRVKELEANERQAKKAMSRLSRIVNTIQKTISFLKVKIHNAEGSIGAVKNSLRNM